MIRTRFHFTIPLLLLIFCCFFPLDGSDHLSYTIRPVKSKHEVMLEVVLKFETQDEVSTFLFLPSEWAGQSKLYHEIVEIECLTSQATLERTEQPDILRIHHAPNEKMEIRYRMRSTHSQALDGYYRPIIEKNHFLFFGHCFFITPQMDHKDTASITLEWKHFPEEWSIANSFGAQERRQKLRLPLQEFLHAAFSGGDFTLIACGEEKRPIYVAIRDQWSFSSDHLTDLLETIIEGQRNFWQDDHFPYYLVTVLPSPQGKYIAGTALNNSFSIFINDFPERSDENWNQLAWLLSHEHFHTWNGLKMVPDTSSSSMTWFTEGFTEYYAVELNYRMHLMDFEEYLSAVNTVIYDYYTSPVRNAKNEKIDPKFWKNWHYQRLPYVRGFLLALKWNHEIKRLTDNGSSLDDLMHALFKQVRKSGKSFDSDDIAHLAGKYMGRESTAHDIKDYIEKGKTILLDDDLFKDLAVLEWVEELGFNLKKTEAKGWIQGVVKDSAAYEGGLRDGQLFIKYEATSQEVTVYISEDGLAIKAIRYPHERKDQFYPQFFSLSPAAQKAA